LIGLRKVLSLVISDRMTKLIIATSFAGIIMKSDPWDKAHVVWFEHFAKKLNKPEIVEYAKKENWFDYVDQVMALAEPKLDGTLRTIVARERYFKIVCDLGCDDPVFENKEIISYLKSIKEKFSIGLITTTPQKIIEKIQGIFKIENLFDFAEYSKLEEKDNKIVIFERFIENNGQPIIYFGSARKEVIGFCKKNKISFVSSIKELKKIINSLE
jgi:hypothetical protein